MELQILEKAFRLMCTAKTLAEKYEENKEVTSKYVHATSRGHEAIQLAVGLQLLPGNKYYIFGRDGAKNLAEGMNIPFLGHIPLVQSVREAGDVGRPAVFQENTPTSQAFDELTQSFLTTLESFKKK